MQEGATIYDYDTHLRALAGEALAQRVQFARQMGQSFDGQRDLYTILGYNRELTLDQLCERYDRGGIAGTIVDALPNATWRGGVELIEDETTEQMTEFEQAWADFDKRHRATSRLLQADILSRKSSFSVLLIGVPGDNDLKAPMPKGKPGDVIFLKPYMGNYVHKLQTNGRRGIVGTAIAESISSRSSADIIVSEFDDDPASVRFGQPVLYELTRTTFSQDVQPRFVHWSRVVHIADGLDDDVFARPALERPWNLLDDLIKVTGGGAEAFFQRANQGRNVKVDKDIQRFEDKDKERIREQLELLDLGYGKNIFTRGVDVNTFGSDVADFSSPADAIITQIAGTERIPKRIFMGSEMGELASSQDRENWKDQVDGRRQDYAGPSMLFRLADRLIEYGYLPKPKAYTARWGTILNMTEEDRRAGLTAWCGAKTEEGPAFTLDEIRATWANKPPLDAQQREQIQQAQQARANQKAQAAQAKAAATFPRAAEDDDGPVG